MLNLAPRPVLEDGVTYHVVRPPAGKTTNEFAYAFLDGYLIAGPSRAGVAEAIRLRKTAAGLARSQKYQDALLPGHPPQASAVLYRDPAAMVALQSRMMGPEMSQNPLMQMMGNSKPTVLRAYAGETTIRGSTTSGTADVGGVAAIAAIAIPNLLRSRVAANESSAVGSLRTLNTAQVTYAATYSDKRFAASMEALGPDPKSSSAYSPEHAGLLDGTLGCADMWCAKSGYRFTITAVCRQQDCKDYVSVATPLSPDSGGRNFCSTSEGVIRFKAGPPLTSPVTPTVCRTWTPLP
jgi:type II secretory pathway pseudopilin PulG